MNNFLGDHACASWSKHEDGLEISEASCKTKLLVIIIFNNKILVATQHIDSPNNFITDDTFLLLETAADDNTKREEETGRYHTTCAEVILNISTTVGTAVPAGKTRSFCNR